MSSINADVTTTVDEARKSSQTDFFNGLSSPFTVDINQSSEMIELNNRIRSDLMNQCSEFLRDDDEGRHCVERVWKKYLRCVGDAATLAAFFDALPLRVKKSVLPKYQKDIIQWCCNLFHFKESGLLYSTYYAETFQRVIRFALKNARSPHLLDRTAIIYVAEDFDPDLILDLLASISNIVFQHVRSDQQHQDMISVAHLQELIQRDLQSPSSYPAMVIATAGTALLGHCDDLTQIKVICDKHDVWLHVIGDLLGSLALNSDLEADVTINADSVMLDIIKLFGIQNLPYLTFFLRSTIDSSTENAVESKQNELISVTSQPFYDFILHSPSINFLTIWSISQRCSDEEILGHMKYAFSLSNLCFQQFQTINSIRLFAHDQHQTDMLTYQNICTGSAPNKHLPKSVIIFRFEPKTIPTTNFPEEIDAHIDYLNLWLFDKISQAYPKMNLELLKSINFQVLKSDENPSERIPAHAIRFSPLEHVLDNIENEELNAFFKSIQNLIEILLATLHGRLILKTKATEFDRLQAVIIPGWAGVGGIRYIPDGIDYSDEIPTDENTAYRIDSIQAELAKKLQTKDSAFSLGSNNEQNDAMFYLRLGMIKRAEDLDVLLSKIASSGKEVEQSLKYVEDMAEKIKSGIEKVQKDLEEEQLRSLAERGLLRQLPLVSNLMSWWSPVPALISTGKGRSYDLNTGQIESTERIYEHRMQIQKQTSSLSPETHDGEENSPEVSSKSNESSE